MNDPIIIALSGKKGGGKNTLASFVSAYYGYLSVAEFAFADGIKDFCIDILGLTPIQCYGSDEDKNTSTKFLWENTPYFHHAIDPGNPCLTGRDVMQIFGTECVRSWFGNVWAEATVRKIKKQSLGLAIITDNRFPNEVETILQQSKGYIIRLTRSPFEKDLHSSETALDNFNWDIPKCFVLNNALMSKKEQNDSIITIVDKILKGNL